MKVKITEVYTFLIFQKRRFSDTAGKGARKQVSDLNSDSVTPQTSDIKQMARYVVSLFATINFVVTSVVQFVVKFVLFPS